MDCMIKEWKEFILRYGRFAKSVLWQPCVRNLPRPDEMPHWAAQLSAQLRYTFDMPACLPLNQTPNCALFGH